MIAEGDDLAGIALDAIPASGVTLRNGDVLVFAQKVVSKSEGRLVRLDSVTPSAKAVELGRTTEKDPRIIELVLSESSEVLRAIPGVIIVQHRLGLVLANAGIDRSNIGGEEHALLLPLTPMLPRGESGMTSSGAQASMPASWSSIASAAPGATVRSGH